MLKYFINMLLLGVSGFKRIPPPEDGKFFYVDFPYHHKHGQHAVTAKILKRDGKSYVEYPLFVATANDEIGLIDISCPSFKCEVKKPGVQFDIVDSKNYKKLSTEILVRESISVYDSRDNDL